MSPKKVVQGLNNGKVETPRLGLLAEGSVVIVEKLLVAAEKHGDFIANVEISPLDERGLKLLVVVKERSQVVNFACFPQGYDFVAVHGVFLN